MKIIDPDKFTQTATVTGEGCVLPDGYQHETVAVGAAGLPPKTRVVLKMKKRGTTGHYLWHVIEVLNETSNL